jgi:hypothetical protein
MFSVSISLDTRESESPFSFREVTTNPFVMSHNLVDMWCEVVMTNNGEEELRPPNINFQFSHPVLMQCWSQREATHYRKRLLKADTPSLPLDYLPSRDLNEAMYAELWFSFLDLALPRRNVKPGTPVDLFSAVYTNPLRVVQDVDTFLNRINHFSQARGGLLSAWTITECDGDIYTIGSTRDESLSFRVRVNSRADSPHAFERVPWKTVKGKGRVSALCFPATPRIAVLDNESGWRISPYVQRERGNIIGPGEGIMFWFWWRHLQPFDEGIIHSASPFSDDFILSYRVEAPRTGTELRYNTFLRCSPQLSVAGEAAAGGTRFTPVPVSSEIFSEWAWYTERIDRWLYRFAREGASQYEISASGDETAALKVTAVFSDTHAEQARLSRLLILTAVILGVLINFFAAAVWGWRGAGTGGAEVSGDAHVLGVILSSAILGGIIMIKSWLEYQRFTSNPILVHDLQRYARTWLRRWGLSIADDDERLLKFIRRFGMLWSGFVTFTAVTFVVMVWGYASKAGLNDTLLLVTLFGLLALTFRSQIAHRR